MVKKGIWLVLTGLIALPTTLLQAPEIYIPETYKRPSVEEPYAEAKLKQEKIEAEKSEARKKNEFEAQQSERAKQQKAALEAKRIEDLNLQQQSTAQLSQKYKQQKQQLNDIRNINSPQALDTISRNIIDTGVESLKKNFDFTTYNEIATLAQQTGYKTTLEKYLHDNPDVQGQLTESYQKMLTAEQNPGDKKNILRRIIELDDLSLDKTKGTGKDSLDSVYSSIKDRLALLELVNYTQEAISLESELTKLFRVAKDFKSPDVDLQIQLQRINLLNIEYNKNALLNPKLKPIRVSEEAAATQDKTLAALNNQETDVYDKIKELYVQQIEKLDTTIAEVAANQVVRASLLKQKAQLISDVVGSALEAAKYGQKVYVRDIVDILDHEIEDQSKNMQNLALKAKDVKTVKDFNKLADQFTKQYNISPAEALATVLTGHLEKAWMETIGNDGNAEDFLESMEKALELSQKVLDKLSPDLAQENATASQAFRMLTAIPSALRAVQTGFSVFGEPPHFPPAMIAEDFHQQANKDFENLKKTMTASPNEQLYYDTRRSFQNALSYYDKALIELKDTKSIAYHNLEDAKQKVQTDFDLFNQKYPSLQDKAIFTSPLFEQNYADTISSYIMSGATRVKREFVSKFPKSGFANLIEQHNTKLLSPKVKLRVYQLGNFILAASALLTAAAGLGLFELIQTLTDKLK